MDTIKHNDDEYAMCEYVLSSFARSEFIIAERSDYITKTKRENPEEGTVLVLFFV